MAAAINNDTLSSLSSLYDDWVTSAHAYEAKLIVTMTETVHSLQHPLTGTHRSHSPEIPGLQVKTSEINTAFCFKIKSTLPLPYSGLKDT